MGHLLDLEDDGSAAAETLRDRHRESFTDRRGLARRGRGQPRRRGRSSSTMFADPRVTATGSAGRATATRVRAAARPHGIDHWDRPRLRARGSSRDRRRRRSPVGWVGARTTTDVGGPRGVESAATIAADRWRRGPRDGGRATRASRSASPTAGSTSSCAFTMVDNVASRGVMEKLGFAYDCDVEHAGLPHVLYRLTDDRERRSDG